MAIETRDGWIFRFPKSATHPFAREIRILQLLRGRLSVNSPAIEWTGTATRFAAYRKLPGDTITAIDESSPDASSAGRLATSLGRFLASMHSAVGDREAADLLVPYLNICPLMEITEQFENTVPAHLANYVRSLTARFRDRWLTSIRSPNAVVLHNDFHPGNMGFNRRTGRLISIWDFSSVEAGDASYDFRYLIDYSPDLALRAIDSYQAISGRAIDIPAAAVAGEFEAVSDALVQGREILPVVLRWEGINEHLRRAISSPAVPAAPSMGKI